MTGHVGHGLVGSRSSGGFGRSSIWVIEAAPCRRLVPMQSDPVSPPPITTTCFPAAEISSPSGIASPAFRRFCCVRNSIAKWTPLRSLPGTGRSRAAVAPAARTIASKDRRRYAAETSTPALTPVSKTTPSARIWSSRRSMTHFSSLKSGMPYRRSPPIRSDFSKTTTSWPLRASCWAAGSPAGPDPTTATRLPVENPAGSGRIHSSRQPCSTIWSSRWRMVTAGRLIARVHAVSHGAGQTRPVISGRLQVACSRSSAFRQFFR